MVWTAVAYPVRIQWNVTINQCPATIVIDGNTFTVPQVLLGTSPYFRSFHYWCCKSDITISIFLYTLLQVVCIVCYKWFITISEALGIVKKLPYLQTQTPDMYYTLTTLHHTITYTTNNYTQYTTIHTQKNYYWRWHYMYTYLSPLYNHHKLQIMSQFYVTKTDFLSYSFVHMSHYELFGSVASKYVSPKILHLWHLWWIIRLIQHDSYKFVK